MKNMIIIMKMVTIYVMVYNKGMKSKDIRCAEMVLEENKELAVAKWNEYFGNSEMLEED